MSKSTATRGGEATLPLDASSQLPVGCRLCLATAGDHLAIHRLLRQVTQQPSEAEFQAQLDEPSYEPMDRLVVKHGRQVIAHARIIRREMHYETAAVPVAYVEDVVTLPEYRRCGLAKALVKTAEQIAATDGAVLGLLRTHLTEFYHRFAWHELTRPCASTATPRQLLSALRDPGSDSSFAARDTRPTLHIRYWRHVEQAALMRLYNSAAQDDAGYWTRSADMWRWLVSRHGMDRLYVAIEGSPRPELDDTFAAIVGYACERDGRIAEMVGSPDRPDAPEQLLRRICGDALERDLHAITLEAPEDNPLHQLFAAAEGRRNASGESAQVMMTKIFDLPKFISQIRLVLCRRAKQADLPSKSSLDITTESRSYRLEVTPRTARLRPVRKPGRNRVACTDAQLPAFLLGQIDFAQSVSENELTCSTASAASMATALFPHHPLWFPPLEDLPAR